MGQKGTPVPRWYSGNVNITDWMYELFGVLSSIPVNVKTVQMLFSVEWSFLLTVWMTVMRLCAELITRHTKIPSPSITRGSYFEKVISPWRILVPLHGSKVCIICARNVLKRTNFFRKSQKIHTMVQYLKKAMLGWVLQIQCIHYSPP
jgi:hypothetical protein